MQSPQWDQKILISLGKSLYARRSLKDLNPAEFDDLLPRLVAIVEVLEAGFKAASPSHEQALWSALLNPNLDKNLLVNLNKELNADRSKQILSRLAEIMELLCPVEPGPCPSGEPGATGVTGSTRCTTGPSGSPGAVGGRSPCAPSSVNTSTTPSGPHPSSPKTSPTQTSSKPPSVDPPQVPEVKE
jgi:hypothetical protein